MPTEPWYSEGLRFTCTRCGKCCGGAPGYVWVEKEEIARMARLLGMTDREFAREYCRSVWWHTSLKERANGDCVMLTPEGCRVYEGRPLQCRTFPFWRDHLKSPAAWQEARDRCPGMGTGRLYSRQEIESISEGRMRT